MADEKELFLHGACGVFALALHERFGYGIGWAINNDQDDEAESLGHPWQHLIHVFCTDGGKYIDVRGILDGSKALLAEFEDFFDACLVETNVPPERLLDELRAGMSDSALAGCLERARAIIDAGPSAYAAKTGSTDQSAPFPITCRCTSTASRPGPHRPS